MVWRRLGLATAGHRQSDHPGPSRRAMRILSYAHGLDVVLMLVGSISACIMGVVNPLVMLRLGMFIDDANLFDPAAIQSRVDNTCVFLVGLGMVAIVCGTTAVACWTAAGERQMTRIKMAYMKAVLNQDPAWFDSHNPGEIPGAFAANMASIQEAITRKAAELIFNSSYMISSLVVAVIGNASMAGVTLVSLPLIIAGTVLEMRAAGNAHRAEEKNYSMAGAVAFEAIGSIRTVASQCSESLDMARYNDHVAAAEAATSKSALQVGFGWAVRLCALQLAYIAIFSYAIAQVSADIGDGCAQDCATGGSVMTTVVCVVQAAVALSSLVQCLLALRRAHAATASVFAVIDRVPAVDAYSPQGARIAELQGALSIESVKFSYPSRAEEMVFDGLSLSIAAGQSLALVGPSGGGKSTLVKLMLRLYDPSAGRICLDGVDIKALNVAWLRNIIGHVGQEPVLFSGSIRDNIAHGLQGAQEADIIAAAKAADAHAFISSFPAGYDTDVGEGGAQLSGGQKQRLAIARAIVKKPTVLLLDEATSALDNESERAVQAVLDRIRGAKALTTVTIAHRLSTTDTCSRIAVMDGGRVTELGTREELLALGGVYCALRAAQASGTAVHHTDSRAATTLSMVNAAVSVPSIVQGTTAALCGAIAPVIASGLGSTGGSRSARTAAILRSTAVQSGDCAPAAPTSGLNLLSAMLDADADVEDPRRRAVTMSELQRNCAWQMSPLRKARAHTAGAMHTTYSSSAATSAAAAAVEEPSPRLRALSALLACALDTGIGLRMPTPKLSVAALSSDDQNPNDHGTSATAAGSGAQQVPVASAARLWQLVRPEWPLLLVGVAGAAVLGARASGEGVVFAHVQAALFQPTAADITSTGFHWIIGFAVLAGCTLISSMVMAVGFTIAGARITLRVRKSMFNSMLRHHLAWHDAHSTGELLVQLEDDANAISRATGIMLGTRTQLMCTMAMGLVTAFVAAWQLGIMVIAIIPVLAVSVVVEHFAKHYRASKAHMQQRAAAAGILTDSLLAVTTVQALNLQHHMCQRFSNIANDVSAHNIRLGLFSAFSFAYSYAIVSWGGAFVFWYGARLVVAGDISSLNLFVALYVLYLAFCAAAELDLSAGAKQAGLEAAARALKLSDAKFEIDPLSEEGGRLSSARGALSFTSVLFAYPTRPGVLSLGKTIDDMQGKSVTSLFNLDVAAGETVALVGASGGGKSTCMQLIMRFYDPSQGIVAMDGRDVRELNLQWLRSQIGYVGQEPVLFSGSIFDNIARGKQGATVEDVHAAAKAAQAHDFIISTEDGYHTEVGAKSCRLSGGQKQRIAIARAIVRDPAILLLDEATSALDAESERQVQAALDSLKELRRRTTVIIAHRLSTVRNADRIVVIAGGLVAEQGTHAELSSDHASLYASMLSSVMA